MGKAKLEVLGLEVPIDSSVEYHDDGTVDSLEEHSIELIEKYFTSRTEREYQTERTRAGFESMIKGSVEGTIMVFNLFPRRYIHIFYPDLPPEFAIRARAHEETHALEKLGHLDMLAEKILEEQKIKIDFREIGDREVKAEVGAIYALYAHSISPLVLWPSSTPSLEKALDIYKQLRLGE